MSSCESRDRGWNFEGFEECVETDEEFPGDGDDGDIVGFFAFFTKAFVEGGEVWAVSGGGFGGHVEGFADDGATAVDASFSGPGPGLLGVRCEAGEGRCGVSVEGAEFGEMGEQNGGGLGADAGGGLECGGLGSEVGFLGDEVFDLLIELLDEGGQLLDVAIDLGGDEFVRAGFEAVFLADAVLDELGATVGKGPQAASRGGSFLRGRGVRGFAETGDDGGIDGVGFGEHLEALGKVPNTAWLNHGDGDPSVVQGVGQDPFVTSRSFEDDMRLVVLREKFDQRLKPFVGVGQHANGFL